MMDSPSGFDNYLRSSRSRSPSGSSRSFAGRSGTSHHGSSKEYSSSRSSSKGYAKESTKVVQVSNISPQATRQQMQTLFGYVGEIDVIRLYPTADIGIQLHSKICFVKFYDSSSVGIAQHLTNTVFLDRALVVIPFLDGDIPDETRALELLASGSLLPGISDPKLPQHITSQLGGIPPLQVVITKDPKLVEGNLPPYPPLPPTVDSRKIEEIRRTLMICDISADLSEQGVMDFFSEAGEVKYFRFCTRDNDPLKYALIEFSEQPAIVKALQFNGRYLGDKMIRVYHATQAIIKPQAKTNETAQKEIEDAMSRQAQNHLIHGLDTAVSPFKREKISRSRSRTHSRRSRSRGRRRSSSRSRSRRRSRPRSQKRSRPRSHKRSRPRSRRRFRSRSRRRCHSISRMRSHSRSRRRSRSISRWRSRSRSSRRSRSRMRRSSSRYLDRYLLNVKRSHSRSRGRRRCQRRSRSRGRPRKSQSRPRSRHTSRSGKRCDKKKSKKDKDEDKGGEKERSKDKDDKENGDESDVQKKKSDRRSRSPKSESKKRHRSRCRSHLKKVCSPNYEKRSKIQKKDNSDREDSVDNVGHGGSSSQGKRSTMKSLKTWEYDDKFYISRSLGDINDGSIHAAEA